MEHRPTPTDARAIGAAGDITTIGEVVRSMARRVAGADGATFVLREGERCYYADEDAIAPLWKGQRFPMSDCISGWAMSRGVPAVVADIEIDERIPIEAYRPTFVRSLVMVPVGDPATAAIGAYWKTHGTPPDYALEGLLELAHLVEVAIAMIGTEGAPWAPSFGPDART
ncbi:GAF domain-containing protein [Nocardioides sp. GCM10027113]|uniref:GAF domain-containing protein n=1 Tax=unclassified Nocardioides TaxID=2615069 RepID=UPI00360F854F